MQDVGQEGRTVLFVSHNMPAVTRMCERAILLQNGELVRDGAAADVVSEYLNTGLGLSNIQEWPDLAKAPGDDVTRLRAVRVKNTKGQIPDSIDIRHPVGLEMEFDVLESGHVLMPYYDVINDENVKVFSAVDQDPEWRNRSRPAGRYISTAWIPENLLSEGTLYISALMRTQTGKKPRFKQRDAIVFHVVDTIDGDSARGDWVGRMRGAVRPMLNWETEFVPENSAHKTAAKVGSL